MPNNTENTLDNLPEKSSKTAAPDPHKKSVSMPEADSAASMAEQDIPASEAATDTQSLSAEDKNEIDEFARALLERKTEMMLFPEDEEGDVTTDSLESGMSAQQRRLAESSMFSALDQLRMARGQEPISTEEAAFHEPEEEQIPEEDITTESLAASLKTGEIPSSAPAQETKARESHLETAEKRPKENLPLWKQKKFWAVVVLVILLIAGFGVYSWKVSVYDPEHVMTETEKTAYDKLVNYADEYSMMSDAEKSKILNLEADFNSLTSAQQQQIENYFQDEHHTGQTFTALLEQAKQAQGEAEDPSFIDLQNYVTSWPEASDEEKATILSRLDQYNALSDSQKSAINAILSQSLNTDFMTLYNEQQAIHTAALDEQTKQQLTSLQQQLSSLETDRANYVEMMGDAINNPTEASVLKEYDDQIAEIQNQIASLQK